MRFVRVILSLMLALLLVPTLVYAQSGQATLTGRAVLPATTLADSPTKAGQALAKSINGLKLPFDSQPVGSIVDVLPGDYANAWLALTAGTFDTPQHSQDYLLRIYTINLNWRESSGGDGTVEVSDWLTLADPNGKAGKKIQNSGNKTRELTGADFQPQAFSRVADGSLWLAESSGPSLLHFDARGRLLSAPVALSGAGQLQSMTELPDHKTLLVAQRAQSPKTVILRSFNTDIASLGDQVGSITLSGDATSIGGLAMINDHQALVIEQDDKENKAAKFKQVFLLTLNPPGQTLIADLLNIADAGKISTADVFQAPSDAFGLGNSFKFPYKDVSAVYPMDSQTLLVVNNNRVPFGLGRSAQQADDTEFIAVHIGQALDLNSAFQVPH